MIAIQIPYGIWDIHESTGASSPAVAEVTPVAGGAVGLAFP